MPSIPPSGIAPPVPSTSGSLPPRLPTEFEQGSGSVTLPASGESARLRAAHWLEDKFGRGGLPVAALAGGVLGGGLGMLALGPIGAAVGGAAGAFLGAQLFMSG